MRARNPSSRRSKTFSVRNRVAVRTYPALDLAWPARPDDAHLERILAEIDIDGPTGLEEHAAGARVFFSSADLRRRAAIRIIALDPSATCTPIEVPDEDWAERSQADLRPVAVGRLIVDPTDRPRKKAADIIFIRPSMGFGTGHHASTRLCLGLMQRISLSGRRVLDVGTGSGLLAIAACRLGAAGAVGIDHDEDALVAAKESVDLNDEAGRVTLIAFDLSAKAPVPGAPFDVVLANLTGALLVREAATLVGATGRGGELVVSGFMSVEEDAIVAAFERSGLRSADRLEEDGWGAVLFT
jgi:ribosomal protein L11 methyltransferase